MPATPSILNKIKLLLNLAKSPNPNEAKNAKLMAARLIEKHNVTQEELDSLDPKVFYGENEKLFSSLGIVGWMQQLSLAIATYFDCQIVVEETVPSEGEHSYSYFVYGDSDQVSNVQLAYNVFADKVNQLTDIKCLGKDINYIYSYNEGIVDSIKFNIILVGIDMPEIKKPIQQEENTIVDSKSSLTKGIGKKEEPTEKRSDVNAGSIIKDVVAYFKGVADGNSLNIKSLLDAAINSLQQSNG